MTFAFSEKYTPGKEWKGRLAITPARSYSILILHCGHMGKLQSTQRELFQKQSSCIQPRRLTKIRRLIFTTTILHNRRALLLQAIYLWSNEQKR